MKSGAALSRIIVAGVIIIAAAVIIFFGTIFSSFNLRQAEPVSPAPTERTRQFVIGSIGNSPATEKAEFQPFADYLQSKLSSHGITEGVVVVASSPAEMANMIRLGKVDLYLDSPFPAFMVKRLTDAQILGSRWKKGEEKYHSIIFTSKESGITDVSGLVGKRIAFENIYSTSGYFLPKAELLRKKYEVTELQNPSSAVDPKKIGYYFTNDDSMIDTEVLSGTADAGAMDEQSFYKFARDTADQFTIILKSEDVYRNILILRKGVLPEIRSDLIEILFTMHDDEEGRGVLHGFADTTKFEPIINIDDAFSGIKELSGLVEEDIIKIR